MAVTPSGGMSTPRTITGLVLLLSLGAAITANEVAIVAVNFARPRLYTSGQMLYVSKEHPHVIRVCVAGDVRQKCFAESKQLSMQSPGCELVDSDCTCYRWLFNSRGTDNAKALTITPHPTKSGCATVVFRPETALSAGVVLEYQLDHFRPVVPAGWLYATYAKYLRHKQRSSYKKPFFTYVYETTDDICGKQKARPIGLAYNCKKSVNLEIVAIETPSTEHGFSVFVPAFGIILFLVLALVKR